MFIKWRLPWILFPVLVLLTGVAHAGEVAEHSLCQRAQQIVAKTELVAAVNIHEDYEAFVQSKASTSPLTVEQYLSNPPPDGVGGGRVLSCKMKTAERINAAHPGPDAVAQGDGSCQAVNQYWLDQLLAGIPGGRRASGVGELVVDEEELTFMGPMWLRPWPFEPLYRDDEGRVHIRSKALYVPFAWWIPMPDRFKGTYYCHLVAPAYLETVLRGDARI